MSLFSWLTDLFGGFFNAWTIEYSKGMPATTNGTFDFPKSPGSVHYVVRKATERGRKQITMRYRIEGNGPFVATEGEAPAAVRLMIERKGDVLDWAHISYRFWSVPVYLAAGPASITIPLTPDHWTNVGGKQDDAGFAQVLANLDNVGFTFGGEFAGHGVYVTGPAKFILEDYTLG